MPRREALKGLGALAISAPTFAAIACSSDQGETANNVGSAGAGGTGVNTPTAGSASGGAGSNTSTGATSGTGAAGSGTNTGTGGRNASASGAGGQSAGRGADPAPAGRGGGGTGGQSTSGTSGQSAGGSGGSSATVPMFDDAASCTLTTTDIEGPFFIDDHEFPDDANLIRSDIREGLPGVETRLYFRVLDAKKQCAPIAGAELYIWHCNADGYYSGFNGQDPSKPYMGAANPTPMNKDRFCRGVQLTDDKGIGSFTTMYPGWYAGRPIHIHLMGRFDGVATRLITTQLYFAAAFTKEVHGSEPAYMARAASIPAGSANPPSGKPAMPTMKHTPGLVIGTLNVIVNRA
jgi:protocatechuate 3,4-dioxygenase beta subunit